MINLTDSTWMRKNDIRPASENVLVCITTPQIVPSGSIVSVTSCVGADTASGAAGPARASTSSNTVELGWQLLVAARAGDTSLVLDLMAQGAAFTTDWLGTSPLHLAAGNGHLETCAVLLRAGVSRDTRTKVDRTPMHLAAYSGHRHIVILLHEAGADVNCTDMLHMTPLHWAVQCGHISTVAELLSRGADPSIISKFMKTARSIAVELKREDIVQLIDDTIREREQHNSVQHIVTEQMSETPPMSEPQLETLEPVQRIQNTKTNKTKPETEKVIKSEIKCKSPSQSNEAAARLLREHGITLLPADDTSTVLNAIQSGRTVVLSDAGKLMLKESSESSPSMSTKPSTHVPQSAKNMVLTATPVKSPPKPGMKIFTLNNKLLAIPKDATKVPIRKIIHPQDLQQMKFVQLPNDANVIPASGVTSARGRGTTKHRPAVKIIMDKSNFNRLMASATKAEQTQQSVELSPMDTSCDADTDLRVALAASRRALVALQHELRVTRDRLAKYENVDNT